MEKEIDIDRQKIVTYWWVNELFSALVLALVVSVLFSWLVYSWFFMKNHWWDAREIFLLITSFIGIVLVLALIITVHIVYFLPWYYKIRVNALRYCFVSKALRIESGVLFRSRKTIPYEKITSVELVQGPVLRYFNMWVIKVQTASTGSLTPEATLLGVVQPTQIRDEIFYQQFTEPEA